MDSLNAPWTSASFHLRVAKLSRAADGDRIIDLGCGREAKTVPHLLSEVGVRGHVVAVDRVDLAPSAAAHREAFDAGRLSFARLDIRGDLPFADAAFDRVICQNVLECVPDRARLLSEIRRVLRPGGTALIGHHDFDGTMIASEDRDLTRRLLQAYADDIQPWQDASDGQMGRQLPGLVAAAGFKDCVTETMLFVDLELAEDSYAKIHLDGIAGSNGISRQDAHAWLDALRRRSASGRFYYAIPWVYVLAAKGR